MKIFSSVVLIGIGLMTSSFVNYYDSFEEQKPLKIIGAWETTRSDGKTGLWIITNKHFSFTFYSSDEFLYTEGGYWSQPSDGNVEFEWEYHTQKPELVGTKKSHAISLKGNSLTIADTEWKRVDNGGPGKLAGAWLITGRYRDGEMSERTPGARRTMKILSGTKFQWIAYNVDTKEFFGTGGGSYTSNDGKYVEKIEFFSRDNSRVGASLQFDFKLENGKWRHSGKSSKGDPLDEVWTKREELGI
ncbi:MAG: membrane or secreted protein [Cyclobacteriaceae bacterium]